MSLPTSRRMELLPSAFIGLMILSGVPLFFGASIRRIFDGELLNETYWRSDVEKTMPFYKHRRAGVYLAALGSRNLSRRRFPGADLRAIAPKFLYPFAALYLVIGGLTCLIILLVLCFLLVCGRH